MYKIKFYNSENQHIATHIITADHIPCGLTNVENYCKMIADTYDGVCRWDIFKFDGRLIECGSIKN